MLRGAHQEDEADHQPKPENHEISKLSEERMSRLCHSRNTRVSRSSWRTTTRPARTSSCHCRKLAFDQVRWNRESATLAVSIFPSAEFSDVNLSFHRVITGVCCSNPKVLTAAVPSANNPPACGAKPSQQAVRIKAHPLSRSEPDQSRLAPARQLVQ